MEVDDDQVAACICHDSVLTEQDIVDFHCRWQAQKQDLRPRCEIGGIGCGRYAVLDNCLHGLRAHIERRERNSGFGKVRCHPEAHATQADKPDSIFVHDFAS